MWGQMHHYCPIQRLKGHRLTSKHSKVSFCFVTCASENVFTQITNLGGKAVNFSKAFCLRSFFKLRCANEVLVNALNYVSVRCFTICAPNRKMLSIFLQSSLCLFHIFFLQNSAMLAIVPHINHALQIGSTYPKFELLSTRCVKFARPRKRRAVRFVLKIVLCCAVFQKMFCYRSN